MANIDITHIPFSRYGAYVSVTGNACDNTTSYAKELIIHSARRRFSEGPTFSLTFGANEAEEFSCSASPEALKVSNKNGRVCIYVRDDDTLAFESEGLDLHFRLLHYGYGTETGNQSFRIISGVLSLYSTFRVVQGKAKLDGPYLDNEAKEPRYHKTMLDIRCEEGKILAAVSICSVEPKDIKLPIEPKKEIAAIREEWEAFSSIFPDLKQADNETENFMQITQYNLWSCFVRAQGIYKNDTILMSKKNMTSTWSWDHCFNALAMAHLKDKKIAKEIAFNQFLAPFHLQSEHGVLPDM